MVLFFETILSMIIKNRKMLKKKKIKNIFLWIGHLVPTISKHLIVLFAVHFFVYSYDKNN